MAESSWWQRQDQISQPRRVYKLNSGWFHWKCSLPMSARYRREHESLENQAAIGV